MKVFLGGTCNGSLWRQELINLLEIDYFNPVCSNWTSERVLYEQQQKELCDFCLYVITPKMSGVYAIAEAIDSSNKYPKRTIFVILDHDGGYAFDTPKLRSLNRVADMVQRNGGLFFNSLADTAIFLNNSVEPKES
jgi:hypothetical protein